MVEIIRALGIPAILLGVLAFLAREVTKLIVASRLKLRDDLVTREVARLEQRLADFYLPLRERLDVSRRIHETTAALAADRGYANEALSIESQDSLALRKIMVRSVFLPLNRQVEDLILDCSHHRVEDDNTDYPALAQHFVLWRALENALASGEISNYDGSVLLAFPSNVAEEFYRTCERLLDARNQLYHSIAGLRAAALAKTSPLEAKNDHRRVASTSSRS